MMQLRRDPGSRSAIRQRARGAKLDAAGGGDMGNVVRRNIALASQHTTEWKTKDLAARFERDRKVGVNERRGGTVKRNGHVLCGVCVCVCCVRSRCCTSVKALYLTRVHYSLSL